MRFSQRPCLTLPVSNQNGFFMDPKAAHELGVTWHDNYINAKPFAHAVFDQFLPSPVIEEALAQFPQAIHQNDYQAASKHIEYLKRGINPIDCSARARELFYFFNSPCMLKFLEGLTGIQALIPDPYFLGGGYHEIKRGGKLAVHADFRINKQLHLNRRLNVLIYLNKDWSPEYGGNLELWDQSMQNCCDSIEPIFNRCVIFNTNEDSYHGHPEALNTPSDLTRKSIALYYYTASTSIYDESPDRGTYFNFRPQDDASTKKKIIRRKLRTHIAEFFFAWTPPAISRHFKKRKY